MQREPRRNLVVIHAFIVTRRILLPANVIGGLLIGEHGHLREEFVLSREDGALDGGVKSGGVDERLEDGACRPLGDSMIQLGGAITAPAHQRQHLASVRIERHKRHLRICPGLTWLVMSMLLVHLFIDNVDCGIDRGSSFPLQIRIERSVDAQSFAVKVAIAEFLLHLVMNQVDEVGCLAGVYAGFREMERLSFGALGLLLGDGAGFHH